MYHEFTKGDVAIMICSDCNTSCKHCYIGYSGNYEPQKLVRRLRLWKEKFNIVLNGTEPLLNPTYLDAYELIGQKNILTNGIVLDQKQELYSLLKEKGITKIGISYHFQSHNTLSSVPEGLIFRVISEAVHRGFSITINTTITPENYSSIIDNCIQASKLGATQIHFTNYMNHGLHNKLGSSLIISYDQRMEFFKQLSIARGIFDKEKLYISRCGTFENDIYTGKDNFYCGIYEYGLAVAPDDKVYPCIFLTGPGEEIGYVENDKIFIRNDLVLNSHQCASFQRSCK